MWASQRCAPTPPRAIPSANTSTTNPTAFREMLVALMMFFGNRHQDFIARGRGRGNGHSKSIRLRHQHARWFRDSGRRVVPQPISKEQRNRQRSRKCEPPGPRLNRAPKTFLFTNPTLGGVNLRHNAPRKPRARVGRFAKNGDQSSRQARVFERLAAFAADLKVSSQSFRVVARQFAACVILERCFKFLTTCHLLLFVLFGHVQVPPNYTSY